MLLCWAHASTPEGSRLDFNMVSEVAMLSLPFLVHLEWPVQQAWNRSQRKDWYKMLIAAAATPPLFDSKD